jgi:uncharacterized membrane protein
MTTDVPAGKISKVELGQLRRSMLERFEAFESSFRQKYPLTWWGTLVGPFVLTAAILLVVWLQYGAEFVGKLVWTTVIAFFFFGRFIILSGQEPDAENIRSFLTSQQLFILITYLDLLVAVVLSFHIGFLFKVPVLGPKVSELVADGRVILTQQPWMRRMTYLGLVAFVVFPLAATGSVGGSIFGRLLGMTRWSTLSGIAMGSIIGNGIMYFGSDFLNRVLDKDDPRLFWGGVAVIAILIILLERRYRMMKKRMLEE